MTESGNRDTNWVSFRDSRFDKKKDKEYIQSVLGQHAVSVVAAPHFTSQDKSLESLSGTKNLLQKVYGDSASVSKDRKSGFAAKVDGSLLLNTSQRIATVLGGYNAGSAESMYHVDAASTSHLETDAGIAEQNKNARNSLPKLISPAHSASLQSSIDDTGKKSYAVFVTANDVAAAKHLETHLLDRSKQGTPVSLHELTTSNEYAKMLEAAQCRRDQIAQQFASAAGVKLTSPAATATTEHFSIVPENVLAHGEDDALVVGAGGKKEKLYVVYNNTSNASANSDSGSIVSGGVLGGKTLLKPRTGESTSWHQKDFLSLMPTNKVEKLVDDRSSVHERHVNDGDSSSVTQFNNRVMWNSSVSDEQRHPHAEVVHNDMTDRYSANWLEKLNASDAPPLVQTHYKPVLAQLPDVTTHDLTSQQVFELANDPQTPPSIELPVNHPVVGEITKNWNTLRTDYANTLAQSTTDAKQSRKERDKARLTSIFSQVTENMIDEPDQMLKSGAHSLCTIAGHTHVNDAVMTPVDTVISVDKKLIQHIEKLQK